MERTNRVALISVIIVNTFFRSVFLNIHRVLHNICLSIRTAFSYPLDYIILYCYFTFTLVQEVLTYFELRATLYIIVQIYCILQVPTEMGLVSHQVQLEVLVPDVFILGPKDLIIDRGTTLSLVCIVENVSNLRIVNRVMLLFSCSYNVGRQRRQQ